MTNRYIKNLANKARAEKARMNKVQESLTIQIGGRRASRMDLQNWLIKNVTSNPNSIAKAIFDVDNGITRKFPNQDGVMLDIKKINHDRKKQIIN